MARRAINQGCERCRHSSSSACQEAPSSGTRTAPPTRASATATVAASAVPPQTSAETEAKLKAAVDGPQRLDRERARDPYLHPVDTLKFYGLREEMTVVELSPDKGQWTAVLA